MDIGSTRTYHVDEREPLYAALFNKSSVFCQNYDSPYLLYPLTAPHGASRSGLLTFSPANITAADRVELPAPKPPKGRLWRDLMIARPGEENALPWLGQAAA